MDQVGKVLSVKDGMASLEVRRISGCGTNCGACASSCDVPAEKIQVIDTLQVSPGDFVVIETDTSRLFKNMLILYGLPTLALVVGIVIGMSVFHSEGIGFLVGLGLLIVSGIVLKIRDSRSEIRSEDLNYMTKIL